MDAFSFEGPDGVALRPAAEFNARFTTGSIAVGLLRRARAAGIEIDSRPPGGETSPVTGDAA